MSPSLSEPHPVIRDTYFHVFDRPAWGRDDLSRVLSVSRAVCDYARAASRAGLGEAEIAEDVNGAWGNAARFHVIVHGGAAVVMASAPGR